MKKDRNKYLENVYNKMFFNLYKKYYIDDFLGINEKYETETNKRTERQSKNKSKKAENK